MTALESASHFVCFTLRRTFCSVPCFFIRRLRRRGRPALLLHFGTCLKQAGNTLARSSAQPANPDLLLDDLHGSTGFLAA